MIPKPPSVPPPVNPVLAWARRYVAAGLSVIPVNTDGSKAPKFNGWREFSDRRPTDAELIEWFGQGQAGIGVVPGTASGNLVVLDFEHAGGAGPFAEWLEKLNPKFKPVLTVCPIVRTPSGGRHVWLRLPGPLGGTRLARFFNGKTKVEIRGEGHQVLAPGCPPECHKSGSTYEFESWGWLSWAM